MSTISTVLRGLWALPMALGVWLAAMGAVEIFNGLASATWHTAPGRIVASGARLEYEFTHLGERHTGTRLRHSIWQPDAASILKRYPPGSEVTVRTASADGIQLSLLEPGFHWDNAALALLGLALATVSWRRLRPKTPSPA